MRMGIIGAMDSEVANLIARMENVTYREKAGRRFAVGTLSGKEAVVVQSGIGKVAAAITAPKATQAATTTTPSFGKNTEASKIRAGNLPLHGIIELVRIAAKRSRGESIMRHPMTPTALQPSPMQRVRACLPQPPHRAIQGSSKKAILGK